MHGLGISCLRLCLFFIDSWFFNILLKSLIWKIKKGFVSVWPQVNPKNELFDQRYISSFFHQKPLFNEKMVSQSPLMSKRRRRLRWSFQSNSKPKELVLISGRFFLFNFLSLSKKEKINQIVSDKNILIGTNCLGYLHNIKK